MADNIFQRYGIKEVADVSFYAIDDNGNKGDLVLYLDTLKVSTIEQTAEQTEARGGKGNPPLIIWDYGKEINLTIEDALFSAKSMEMMFGDGDVADRTEAVNRSVYMTAEGTTIDQAAIIKAAGLPAGTTVNNIEIYDMTGTKVETVTDKTRYMVNYTVAVEKATEVVVSAQTFPGTYYVVGDTFARNETTGKDEYFQFIIPKAKMNTENTITLEAEGDPTVFNMSLRVMRPADGEMMKLVKYSLPETAAQVSNAPQVAATKKGLA